MEQEKLDMQHEDASETANGGAAGGIDIESIMEQIRKEAEALRYTEPVSFEKVDVPAIPGEEETGEVFRVKDFQAALSQVNALWRISYGHEIAGNPVKKLVARAARKAVKPTGEPMARDITRFNAEVTRGMNCLSRFVRETIRKSEEQNRRITELETEIRLLKEQLEKKA